MTQNEIELNERIAEIEGDIRTVVKTFTGVLESLDIKQEDFKGGTADITQKLPTILSKITMKVVSGQLDTQAFADVTAIAPIMEKYKYLVTDIIPQEDVKA